MVIFVLRHADRSSSGSDGLSPAGVRRAEFLAHMLADSGVSVAFCSDAARTRQTLAPLSARLGAALAINEIPAAGAGGIAAHVADVVAAIEALPPATVAVAVSHSNTVGRIVEGLGGGAIAPIADNEFDRLVVLHRPARGQVDLLQLRY